MITKEITDYLFSVSDEKYKLFQAKLMPGIELDRIIGVRTPILRAYAKKLCKTQGIEEFLSDIPHKYYDENNLHGFIISEEKDFDKAVKHVDALLPYVDNWATCDLLSPKAFGKNKQRLKEHIDRWIASDKTYTVRFGIEMLMSHFIDEDFDVDGMKKVSEIKSDEYYINMMIAWYFATALAKQWNETFPYIENKLLPPWVHNKTVQKAVESYRISDIQKTSLRKLKL